MNRTRYTHCTNRGALQSSEKFQAQGCASGFTSGPTVVGRAGLALVAERGPSWYTNIPVGLPLANPTPNSRLARLGVPPGASAPPSCAAAWRKAATAAAAAASAFHGTAVSGLAQGSDAPPDGCPSGSSSSCSTPPSPNPPPPPPEAGGNEPPGRRLWPTTMMSSTGVGCWSVILGLQIQQHPALNPRPPANHHGLMRQFLSQACKTVDPSLA